MDETHSRREAEPAYAHVGSRRSSAGLLSLASSFYLGVGPHLEPGAVRGYPIDMRVKARTSTWPPAGVDPHRTLIVALTQFGLGCHEHWLELGDERWIEAALGCGGHLVDVQRADGGWPHVDALHHTFDLRAPWLSAMAQGQAASLLVRLYQVSGDERFADAASRAMGPMLRDVADGGVQTPLCDGPWLEEYPTRPPSFVLNGAIFALWGARDVGLGLAHPAAAELFEGGLDVLVRALPRFDIGWWSLYSLGALPIRNVASSFYHTLHVSQLEAMHRLHAHPGLADTAERWRSYAARRGVSSRVVAQKLAFRMLVPRSRLLARPAARFWASRG